MIALCVIMYVVLTLEYLGIIYPHDPFFYNTPETVLLYNFQSVRNIVLFHACNFFITLQSFPVGSSPS